MSFNNVQFFGSIKLDNIHAQNRALDYADLLTQDYRYLSTGDYSSSTTFKTNTTQHITSIPLDSTRSLVCYYQGAGSVGIKFIILDSTGTVLSTEFSVIGFDSQSVSMTLVDTDKILVCYGYASTEGRGVILTTTSNTITMYGQTTFTNSQISQIAVDLIDTTSALVVYRDDTNTTSKAQIISISGNTITENSANEIEYNSNNQTTYNNIHVLSSTKAVVFFQDLSDLTGKGQILTFSGTSFGTPSNLYQFDTFASYVSSFKISSTKIILGHFDSLVGQCRIVDVSGTDIIYRTETEFNGDSSTYISITEITNDDLYLIAYVNNATNKYGTSTLVSILNDNLIQLEETENFTTNKTIYMSTSTMGNSVLILYQDIDVLSYGKSSIGSNFAVSTTKVDFEQVWLDDYTVFLANFENTLDAGNVSSSITGWRLKRKAEDGSLFVTLSDFSQSTTSYIDYLVRNNIDYTYAIYSLSAVGESLGIEATDSVNFYGWILTDGTVTYKFDIGWETEGLRTDNIVNNVNKHVYNNYTQYPIVSFGQQNYKTSSLTTIPYSLSTTTNSTNLCYTINETVRSTIESFINNNEEKWLKNTAGEIFKVVTSNFNYKYKDQVQSQPHEISFDWIEVRVGETGL